MYTPSKSDYPAGQLVRPVTSGATGEDQLSTSANNNNNNGGQYYAGSSSLGQETDVMHQYYTEHSATHHHHQLAAQVVDSTNLSQHSTSSYHPHHHHNHNHNHHHHHLQPHAHHLNDHNHHNLNHNHNHHHHQHHHHQLSAAAAAAASAAAAANHHSHHTYPTTGCTTTESSLSSSAFMTQSALRLSALFRSFCSKKCLLVFCLSLILLIFIFVISLSAYLNFLINASKTNLSPLSGRLRVNSPIGPQQEDSIILLLNNRTSKEFLTKQRDYEIILRGALDRTQNLLKTYPNHLVKLEVYAFKPALNSAAATATATLNSLWIYYRLFLNKKSLMQDGQLMKRKSPDEHLERQFLPRLTQQSLQSGFEQLLATFNTRSSRSINNNNRQQQQQQLPQPQQQQLKSFDDQISRLMPIIESIDLQSIQVSPEFDMLAMESVAAAAASQEVPQSMSDNLRASQPLTTTTTMTTPLAAAGSGSGSGGNTIMVATGKPTTVIDVLAASEKVRKDQQDAQSDAEKEQQQQQDQVNPGSKKFTLYGYKENSTRPTTTTTNGARRDSPDGIISNGSNTTATTNSLFLLNHQQRKPTSTSTSTTTTTTPTSVRNSNGQQQQQQMVATNQPPALISSSRTPNDNTNGANSQQVVRLVSGQPVRVANTPAVPTSSATIESSSSTSSSLLVRPGNSPDDKSSSSNRSHFDPNPNQKTTPTTTSTMAQQQQQHQVNQQSSSSQVGQPAHDSTFSSSKQKSTLGQAAATRSGANRQSNGNNNSNSNNNNNSNGQPVVVTSSNEMQQNQMLAPYQKIEYSTTESLENTMNSAQQRPNLSNSGNPSFFSNGQLLSGVNSRDQQLHDSSSPSSSSFSNSTTTTTTTPTSLIELWNKAVKSHNYSSSPTRQRTTTTPGQNDDGGQLSLISVTTIGAGKKRTNEDWQKTLQLSPDISDTIRAELVNAAAAVVSAAEQSSSSSSSSSGSTQKPPKISPHLNHGGSLIKVASNRPATNMKEQPSAIILNRDFKQQANLSSATASSSSTTTTTTTPDKGQLLLVANKNERQSTTPAGQVTTQTSRNPATSSTVKPTRQQKQPGGNSNKKKKVAILQAANHSNHTNDTGTPAAAAAGLSTVANLQQTTRGIRIVDNFLATLEANSNNNNNSNNKTVTSANQQQQQQQQVAAQGATASSRNKSQEAFNYNADNLAPTLPTTIELTRSTTVSSPSSTPTSRTSSFPPAQQVNSRQEGTTATTTTTIQQQQHSLANPHHHHHHHHQQQQQQHQVRNNVDFTTTASSTGSTQQAQGSISSPAAVAAATTTTTAFSGTTESPFRVQQQQQQQTNRDRSSQTSQFTASLAPSSGSQWRPIQSTTSTTPTMTRANFTGSHSNFSQRKQPTTSTTHLIVPSSAQAATISSQIQRPTNNGGGGGGGSSAMASVNQLPSMSQQQQQQQQTNGQIGGRGGSQSPFAMSILEATDSGNGNGGSTSSSSSSFPLLTNVVHVTTHHQNGGNESTAMFESHRTSRMKSNNNNQLMADQMLNSSSSANFDSLNLNNDDRIVDDFMITPDKIVEGNTRGTTLIPPLVLSSFNNHNHHHNHQQKQQKQQQQQQLQNLQSLPGSRISKPASITNAAELMASSRPRTKGPFAFETLKEPSSSASSLSFAADSLNEQENGLNLAARLVERSLAAAAAASAAGSNANSNPFTSNGQLLDEKVLVRKRLFLGGNPSDEGTDFSSGSSSDDSSGVSSLSLNPTDPLNSSPATTNPIESLTSSPSIDSSNGSSSSTGGNNRFVPESDNSSSPLVPFSPSPGERLEAHHQHHHHHHHLTSSAAGGSNSNSNNNNNNNYYRLDRFGVRTRQASSSSSPSPSWPATANSLLLPSNRQKIPASAVRIIMRKHHNSNKEESESKEKQQLENEDNSAGHHLSAESARQPTSSSNVNLLQVLPPPQPQPQAQSQAQSILIYQATNKNQQQQQQNPFKCQYYGCRSKSNNAHFICLNYTQICDDFIDCQDESDELDCVSLLKYDDITKTQSGDSWNLLRDKNKRLSFSNGAGIIYLNRKGLLAPMCIDYFGANNLDNKQHGDGEYLTTTRNNNNNNEKQQELIRQINTIGQYACSLQSFSKLVSVKINHHNLVDGLDLIKNSKLYHRLSIVGPQEGSSSSSSSSIGDTSSQYGGLNSSGSTSFRSGSSEHEVEISTSPDCPSQRTVFVKCGGFECGQDSFSIIQDQKNNNQAKKRNGVIINNFPWLVKLYWMGSLSCHGYLIDELWLISSSECFVNKTTTTTTTKKTTSDDDDSSSSVNGGQPTTTTTATGGLSSSSDDNSGWTAEISYEHYGKADDDDDNNDEGRSIPIGPSNRRRNINEILVRAPNNEQQIELPNLGSPIVLAKLEEPVRFSPLNRPICLPLPLSSSSSSSSSSSAAAAAAAATNKTTLNSETLPDKHYKDCFTIGLPSAAAAASSSSSSSSFPSASGISSNGSLNEHGNDDAPTQSLTLNKVKVNEIMNCFTTTTTTTGNSNERPTIATRTTAYYGDNTTTNKHEQMDGQEKNFKLLMEGENYSNLICVSENEEEKESVGTSRVSTISNKNDNEHLTAKRISDDSTRVLICSTIQSSSRSRSKWTVVGVQYRVPELEKQLLGSDRHLFARVSSQIDWIVDTMNPKSSNLELNNNPDDARVNLKSDSPGKDQSQTCNKFKCSSGECLSWSRICDGLYDCSSQDDEKDCHK